MSRTLQVIVATLLLAIHHTGSQALADDAAVGTPITSPAACPPASADRNAAIARRWHEEAINQGKLDVIDEIVAPDILHRSVTFTNLTGPAGVKQNLAAALASFPDLHYTIEDVIKEGDRVVVRWSATGTQKDAFQGIAPTDKRIAWTGVNIYRMACDRITEVWTEVDGVGRLRQLGALPAK